jgi:uncharacterized membrane protein YbaN (DUF454 family)
MQKQAIKRILLIISGSLSLVLGMIGIVLPILPTTPFLILAAFCFLRSSSRLYNWLIGHKVFGRYIYNYMTYRAVMKRTKIVAMVLLWASLLISIMVVDNLHIRLLLLVVGLAVSIHIATLKTLMQIKHSDDGEESNSVEVKDHDQT